MSRAENLKILKSMEEAHELVSRHADSSRNNAELAAQLQGELTRVRENSEKMKSVCDEKQSELNKLATRHQEMEQTWQEKEKSLQKRLQVLQGDYEALSKSHTSVEELNTNWAEKNTTLTEEIKMLKERFDQKEGEEHKLKLENERKLLMLQEQLDASMRQVASLQQEVHQWKSRERSNIATEQSREKTDCVEECEADVFIEEEFFSPPTSPEEQREEKATIEENSSSQTASSTVKTPERMRTVHKSEARDNTDCASEMVVSKRRLDEVNNTGGDETDGVPGTKKRKQDVPETDGGNLKHTRKEHLLLPDSESHKSKEGRLDDTGSLRSIRGRCGPSEISKLMTCDISEQIALSSSQNSVRMMRSQRKGYHSAGSQPSSHQNLRANLHASAVLCHLAS
ncbi:uncharacterized protein [Ptychodera flava]|uniref:uncharacterized protein isoform X2 n=1 Tax=Ptychodera flava TaxID=63121 RepID=UPI003969E2E2